MNELRRGTLIERLKRTSRIDGMVDGALDPQVCEELRKHAAAIESPKDIFDDDLLICAASLSVQTLLYRTEAAGESLGPMRKGTSGFDIKKSAFDAVRVEPVNKARFASQVANTFYRLGQLEAAREWISEAAKHFDKKTVLARTMKASEPADATAIELALTRAEYVIWRARIESRGGGVREAIRDLQDNAIEPLYKCYAQHQDWRTGVSHRLAFALALQSSLHSRLGLGDPAIRAAWEALHHFSGTPSLFFGPDEEDGIEGKRKSGREKDAEDRAQVQPRDTIRLAFTLSSTAEALVSHREGSNRLAFTLATTASKLMDQVLVRAKLHHPVRVRAQLAMARAALPLGDAHANVQKLLDEAREELVEVRKSGDDGEMINRECRSLEAQIALTRAWDHGRTFAWGPALKLAEGVIRARESDSAKVGGSAVPSLLQGEAHLFAGICLVKLRRPGEGLPLVDRAEEIAKSDDRVKLEIGCVLARAEALFEAPSIDPKRNAYLELERARIMCAQVESEHLKERLGELTVLIGQAALIDLNLPFDDAEKLFRQRYVRFHRARANENIRRILESTGWSHSTYYRMKDL